MLFRQPSPLLIQKLFKTLKGRSKKKKRKKYTRKGKSGTRKEEKRQGSVEEKWKTKEKAVEDAIRKARN